MQLIPCTGNWHCWGSPAIPLPGLTQPVPHFFVADDSFAMRNYIMKPYPFKDQPAPNRIFNYRLSRASRIVENAFGIIANRFRVLRKPLIQSPTSTVNIVLAVCVLHNFLMSTQGSWSSYGWITWHRKYRHSWSAVWYVERRRDPINKLVAVTKTTSPQTTKQYQEWTQENFSWLPKGESVGNTNIFECTFKIHTFCVQQTVCCTIVTQFTECHL